VGRRGFVVTGFVLCWSTQFLFYAALLGHAGSITEP
jgi:hypothetical protein